MPQESSQPINFHSTKTSITRVSSNIVRNFAITMVNLLILKVNSQSIIYYQSAMSDSLGDSTSRKTVVRLPTKNELVSQMGVFWMKGANRSRMNSSIYVR